MLQVLPIAVFLLGVPVLLYAFYCWDRLIDIQATEFPAQWEADGKPRKFFRCVKPFENQPWPWELWRGTMCQFQWLFQDPPWATSHPAAMYYLRHWRFLVAAWNLGVMPLFAVASCVAVLMSQ